MNLGFETIGNATLICYDGGPILATDPWLNETAYFGSWTLSHRVPEQQIEAVKNCSYIWVSHGHPDHLNIKSLNLVKDKKILLPDHEGGRIASDLRRLGFDITVLKDRTWTSLSPRIRVLCIADYNQDALLLVDMEGALVIDLNDSQSRGWGRFVQKAVHQSSDSFLLMSFGYGDADMINYFDDNGLRIEPPAALKLPVGKRIAEVAGTFGVRHAVPFSSFHKYQRADSVWARQYNTSLEAYGVGFESDCCELLPAFVRYDIAGKTFEEIQPPETTDAVVDPEKFGDDWSELLEHTEVRKLEAYFQAVSNLERVMDFITFRVGGEDHVIQLRSQRFEKGVVFEAPRRSLMRAVNFEIFDDLVIGNFMKTHLVGKWPKSKLYPEFIPYVTKYADNGRAKSADELREYFHQYRKRAPVDYLRHQVQYRVAQVVRTRIDSESALYRAAQRSWWFVNKRIGA